VRKFVRACRRGWQTYLENPDATNARILQENPELTAEVLRYGVEQLRPLCLPEGFQARRLGEMSDSRWQQLAEQMVEAKLLSDAKVAGAFSTEFLSEKDP
jgi:hypothetical protein